MGCAKSLSTRPVEPAPSILGSKFDRGKLAETVMSRFLRLGFLVLPALLLVGWLVEAHGKKLYKFQDDQGRWVFTDGRPPPDRSATVEQVDMGQKERIWLRQEADRDLIGFYVYNDYAGPVECEVALAEQRNLHAVPSLPRRFTIGEGKSPILFRIGRINPHLAWSYRLTHRCVVGAPVARVALDTPYIPPISPGTSFRIGQGFNGRFSHNGPHSRYAVDLTMPVGTPVHAARDGVVMAVDNDFFRNGVAPKFLNEANHIRILHTDGSMAVYAHLDLERATVSQGVNVKAGDLIGYSYSGPRFPDSHLRW